VGLLVPVTSALAANAATASIIMTPSANTVLVGSNFTVALGVTTDGDWIGWGVNSITFTPAGKITAADTGAQLQNFGSSNYTGNIFTANGQTPTAGGAITVDNTSGSISGIGWSILGSGSVPACTNGKVVTLNFNAVTSGDVTIHLNQPKVTAADASQIFATVTDITIHVVAVMPPTVTGISSASGSGVGGNGDTVTITGTYLTGATTVTLGGVSATNVTVVNANTVTAKVGLGTNGDVAVTTPGGTATLTSGFTYQTGTLASLSPAPPTKVGPGASLVITGTHLKNADQVIFGTSTPTIAPIFTTTETTVTVSVPNLGASANGITVRVRTPDGTLQHTSDLTVDYLGATVSGFSPTAGYASDTVTITGSGFLAATGVVFNNTSAASYQIVDDSHITAVVGNGATGLVGVQYGAAAIRSSSSFTYKAVSVSILPNAQTVNGGSSFTVTLNINTGDALGTKQVRAWQSNISFDPTKLQCTGITEGTWLKNWATTNGGNTLAVINGPVIDNVQGTITNFGYVVTGALSSQGYNQGQTGTGVLATLTFTSVNTPGASAAITPSNVTIDDQNANRIAGVQTVNGIVNVNYPAPSPSTGDTTIDSSLLPQLTLIAPASITGWNLVVSPSNSVQRTMNVFANTGWQVTVSADTDGHMKKYNGSYVVPAVELSSPLQVSSDAGNGTGNGVGNGYQINVQHTSVLLATGTQYGQNQANGGDLRNVFFTQPVTYTDATLTNGYSYHIVVTFTASNTGF